MNSDINAQVIVNKQASIARKCVSRKWLFIFVFHFFIFLKVNGAQAATISASSCSQADVSMAIDSANNGDTVVIPAGTCTWNSNLTISGKALTIQGSGIDQTVIIDEVPRVASQGPVQVLVYSTVNTGVSRITGITFQGGSEQDDNNSGMILISGDSHQFRFDHCRIRTTKSSGLFIYNFVLGVVDHNTFNLDGWHTGIYVHHNSWNNTGDFGDASWAGDSFLGTDKALFVEDNQFVSTAFAVAIDGWMGSHVVFRHNTNINTTWQNHGTETAGRWRGQRTFEIYENKITYDNPSVWNGMVGIRSGTGVVFNNTGTTSGGAWSPMFSSLVNLRQSDRSRPYHTWAYCDGSNIWDGNTDASGYPCLDQPGRGRGSMINDFSPTPVGYTHQVAEPIYSWNNKIDGITTPITTQSPDVVRENRDFFNTIKPGYVPFTYPHPLVSDSMSSSPTVSLAASALESTAGTPVTVTWLTSNVISCSASGNWNGSRAASGHEVVYPTENSTYTLSCIGAVGSAEQSITIEITAMPAPTPIPTPTTPSQKLVIGDRVSGITGGVLARSLPGFVGTVLQQHNEGDLGTVIDGPQTADGYSWWNINYDSGADGWSTETNLNKSTAPIPIPTPTPTTPLSTKFRIGDRVSGAAGGVLARLTPSLYDQNYTQHQAGELGTVTGGPQQGDGYLWWTIDYDSGSDGWSTESNLDHATIVVSTPTTIPARLKTKLRRHISVGNNFNRNRRSFK